MEYKFKGETFQAKVSGDLSKAKISEELVQGTIEAFLCNLEGMAQMGEAGNVLADNLLKKMSEHAKLVLYACQRYQHALKN